MITSSAPQDDSAARTAARARVVDHFDATTRDYAHWSANYDMHFGYWRRGLAPWRLGPMLSQTTLEVERRLGLDPAADHRLVDLGGGVGASARTISDRNERARIDVVTTVGSQVDLGRDWHERVGRDRHIRMVHADYTDTGLESGMYDGAWALESGCQSPDSRKTAMLREAFRLLRPGGRFVMVDAALCRPIRRGPTSWILDVWKRSWAVVDLMRLDLLPAALAEVGFEHERTEDWTWRAVPSLAHVPWRLSRFALLEGLRRPMRDRHRRGHLLASALSLPLALRLDLFAYAAVVARKPAATDRPGA